MTFAAEIFSNIMFICDPISFTTLFAAHIQAGHHPVLAAAVDATVGQDGGVRSHQRGGGFLSIKP